jgi:hypothetical protein
VEWVEEDVVVLVGPAVLEEEGGEAALRPSRARGVVARLVAHQNEVKAVDQYFCALSKPYGPS